MQARTTLVYKVLGWVFLFLGALTLLNVLAGFDVAQTILWRSLGYGVCYLLIAYGCFVRGSWILPAFALNFLALILLLGVEWYARGAFSFLALVVAVAAGIIAAFAYERRRYLRSTSLGWTVGVAFFLVWGATLIYTLSTLLTL
jgi:hypothetical protein